MIRIVTMIEALNLHGSARAALSSRNSRSTHRRSFGRHLLTGNRLAFGNDFRSGGRSVDRSICPNDYGHGSALQTTDPIVFRDAARNFDPPARYNSGSWPKETATLQDWPRAKVFLAHDAPLFARRNVEAQRVAISNLNAIGTEIHPAFVGFDSDVD